MSHVATIKPTFHNIKAIQSTCARIPGIDFCGKGFVSFYDETEVGGYILQLQGWKYPVVIKPDGSLYYDNYNGEWGNEALLDRFKQVYAIEAAKCEAIEQHYEYTEEVLPTGVLKLTINV